MMSRALVVLFAIVIVVVNCAPLQGATDELQTRGGFLAKCFGRPCGGSSDSGSHSSSSPPQSPHSLAQHAGSLAHHADTLAHAASWPGHPFAVSPGHQSSSHGSWTPVNSGTPFSSSRKSTSSTNSGSMLGSNSPSIPSSRGSPVHSTDSSPRHYPIYHYGAAPKVSGSSRYRNPGTLRIGPPAPSSGSWTTASSSSSSPTRSQQPTTGKGKAAALPSSKSSSSKSSSTGSSPDRPSTFGAGPSGTKH
ncbi:unnamed protein product [Sympodiomycopsis kandeliae]